MQSHEPFRGPSEPPYVLARQAQRALNTLPGEQRKDVYAAVREGRRVADPRNARAAVELARARISLGPPGLTSLLRVLPWWAPAAVFASIVLLEWLATRNLVAAVGKSAAVLAVSFLAGWIAMAIRRDDLLARWRAAEEALAASTPVVEQHRSRVADYRRGNDGGVLEAGDSSAGAGTETTRDNTPRDE